MHASTFEYLKPTADQLEQMSKIREATAAYAAQILVHVPEGADRTYIIRKLREVGMWCNVAITRLQDGTPREQRISVTDDWQNAVE